MALIFMDLDGTLLDGGKIVPGVKKAIAALKANGHIPVIATGRIPVFLYDYPETLGIDSVVAANGNYIIYRNSVIRENYIPEAITNRLLALADEYKFDIVVEKKDTYLAYRKDTERVDDFADTYSITRPATDHVVARRDDVLAFVIFDDRIVKLLEKQMPMLEFSRSNRFGYDVNMKNSLKGDGIVFLIEHLDYPEAEIYAIGDGYNDIGMLKAVKNSIAMGNAFPEVKEAAVHVTTDVAEDGVVNALKHFRLI